MVANMPTCFVHLWSTGLRVSWSRYGWQSFSGGQNLLFISLLANRLFFYWLPED